MTPTAGDTRWLGQARGALQRVAGRQGASPVKLWARLVGNGDCFCSAAVPPGVRVRFHRLDGPSASKAVSLPRLMLKDPSQRLVLDGAAAPPPLGAGVGDFIDVSSMPPALARAPAGGVLPQGSHRQPGSRAASTC